MSEWHQRDHVSMTEEKLVRAVHILADIVETNSPAFRPLYHDLRQQLTDLRLQQQAEAAAKARAAQDSSKVA
ncbi:hypothetical protein [Microvirga arabica]|uniref:hypothetical protein n=1 Tax=Microvirga arabica TaxID=1128671 RepID=UPI00193A78E6|nr:hypothetical protein [Microvirga arabica]MBM1170079.1 hypothetical protein [Microvirga arabica]